MLLSVGECHAWQLTAPPALGSCSSLVLFADKVPETPQHCWAVQEDGSAQTWGMKAQFPAQ